MSNTIYRGYDVIDRSYKDEQVFEVRRDGETIQICGSQEDAYAFIDAEKRRQLRK